VLILGIDGFGDDGLTVKLIPPPELRENLLIWTAESAAGDGIVRLPLLGVSSSRVAEGDEASGESERAPQVTRVPPSPPKERISGCLLPPRVRPPGVVTVRGAKSCWREGAGGMLDAPAAADDKEDAAAPASADRGAGAASCEMRAAAGDGSSGGGAAPAGLFGRRGGVETAPEKAVGAAVAGAAAEVAVEGAVEAAGEVPADDGGRGVVECGRGVVDEGRGVAVEGRGVLDRERGAGLGVFDERPPPRELGGRPAAERGRPRVDACTRFTMMLMLRRVSSEPAGGLIAVKGEAERVFRLNGDDERAPSASLTASPLAPASASLLRANCASWPVGEGAVKDTRLARERDRGRGWGCWHEVIGSPVPFVGVGTSNSDPSRFMESPVLVRVLAAAPFPRNPLSSLGVRGCGSVNMPVSCPMSSPSAARPTSHPPTAGRPLMGDEGPLNASVRP